MSFSLRIIDNDLGISFDTKRENMSGKGEKVSPVGYSPNGSIVTRKQIDLNTGNAIQYGWKYVDEHGTQYEKGEVIWKIGDDEVKPLDMTTVFTVKTYRPLSEFNDRFVIEKYYELAPSTGASSKGKKKTSDVEREQTRVSNLVGMRKLWEKLNNEQLVAGGHFNASSGHFTPGMAFIRAIKVNGNKWGLELGVFTEEKIFNYLQEGVPHAKAQVQSTKKCLESSLL